VVENRLISYKNREFERVLIVFSSKSQLVGKVNESTMFALQAPVVERWKNIDRFDYVKADN
jgi:hypothetical protein